MVDQIAAGGADIMAAVFAVAVDAVGVGSATIASEMTDTGGSAMPGWAISEPTGDSVYMTFTLKLIQLLGIIGVLKGSIGTMRFFSAEPHTKKPASLWAPFAQLFFGMMGLIPETVVSIGQSLVAMAGWR